MRLLRRREIIVALRPLRLRLHAADPNTLEHGSDRLHTYVRSQQPPLPHCNPWPGSKLGRACVLTCSARSNHVCMANHRIEFFDSAVLKPINVGSTRESVGLNSRSVQSSGYVPSCCTRFHSQGRPVIVGKRTWIAKPLPRRSKQQQQQPLIIA